MTDQTYDNGYAGLGELPHFSDRNDLVQRTPWWIISIVFHGAFLLMAGMWIVSEMQPDKDLTIFEMDVNKFKKPDYDPTLKREMKKSTREIENEVVIDNPVITPEELPIDKIETPEEIEKELKAKGQQDALSTIPLQNNGWTGVFGVGPGGSDAFGWRDGGGKRRAIGNGGGTQATELAVEAALQWFKRHQAPDGSWSMGSYHEQCREMPPCEHLDMERDYDRWDNAATGFALLCYLGAGHTQKAGRYRAEVAKGLAFLEAAAAEDGSFSDFNYVHAVATMAIAEAYGMTKAANLQALGQRAVDVIRARQNEYLGWDYGNPGTRNDTSVTGWQVMALKSAKSAGLDIGNAFEGAKQHMDKITAEVQGDSDPQLTELCSYTYYTDKEDPGHRNPTCTSISLLCRIFMGQDTQGRVLKAHAGKMLEYLPAGYADGDFYMWYYSTLAMFQMRGTYWSQWNEAIKKVLCDNQSMGGCADGSWAPTTNFSCQHGGRLFTTAMGCLSLEVYYRYLPVAMLK